MMDVYEFSERDDQISSKSKSTKQKKRKSRDVSTTIKICPTAKKSRNKKSKLNENNTDYNTELHPPIKLKLIRDQSDPQIFKSIQIISDVSQSSDISFDIDQQSLLRCKLSDGKEFALNDIVWAKISGYPFWPSKILSLNLSTANQKAAKNCVSRLDLADEYIACVEWLAYDQISYVNCTNLSHFQSDYTNKHSGKIKNKKYFEAVNEAKSLCDENARQLYDNVTNHQMVDSVQSCETLEADTSSSTLPSHNFTSPESNQSVQSSNFGTSTAIVSTSWDLPDLGSNLDFESNNHIPEFSDYEDDCESIDIAKIEFLIDDTHKVTNG